MNIHEACRILEIPIGTSTSELKAAFKKKAIEYHPDRNPENPKAEIKFKEINSAYQFLEKNGTNPPAFNDIKSPFYSTSDDLAEELRRRMDSVFTNVASVRVPLTLIIDIPFEIAISGGVHDLTYTRIIKCDSCIQGKSKNGTKCHKCNGVGRRKYGTGAVQALNDRELVCNKCMGTGVISDVCNDCQGTYKKKHLETVPITIRPGTMQGSKLKFKGLGNYVNGNFGKDFYDDLVLSINVKDNADGLIISGEDVISTVELSLLEALKGTKKSLRTIKGDKILEFKPKIKHGDRVRVAGFGVPPNGAHIFVVNVNYPENVTSLIETLEKKPYVPDGYEPF
jgi:molecular chaperone DnaJ